MGTEKANLDVSSAAKGMVKKQSFKSMIIIFQFAGIIAGDGIPGCSERMSSITALIHRRSCSRCHFPFFFLMTNTGVFHGLVVGHSLLPQRPQQGLQFGAR